MDIPFELHIALRYLLAKRKQAFISVISLISTLGVTVGVMALVIALALMTGLQNELRVRLGDTVSLLTPQGTLSPMGMIPRTRRLRVAGIFSLGLYEFDSTFGYVSLDVAERLFDKDRVDLMQLRVDDIYAAPTIARSITARLGNDYATEDWTVMNASLFSALTLEKMAISMTIGLIVMVAALNIVASLILLVMEKHRDIAILKTMGASRRSVTIVFMLQGLIIGTIGTTVGAAFGWSVSKIFDRYQLISLPADV